MEKQIFGCCGKHAPLRTRRVRPKKSPWITPDLKQRMYDRSKLKRKAIKSRDPNDWKTFKRARNLVNNTVKLSKEHYYKTAFDNHKDNSRKTWQLTSLLPVKLKTATLKS